MNYNLVVPVAIVAACLLYIGMLPEGESRERPQLQAFWNVYKDSARSVEEARYRYEVFKSKAKEVKEYNKHSGTWKKGVNRFSYLTLGERQSMFKATVNYRAKAAKARDPANGIDIREITPGILNKINWKEKGYVSQVKDQKSCSCSYAFAATSVIESALLRNNDSATLSEQEIVDCSQEFGNKGCTSGSITNSLNYIKTKSISKDKVYPYDSAASECRSPSKTTKYTIKGYTTCDASINSLLKNLPIAPIAAAMFVTDDFLDYESGIYDAEASCGSVTQTNAAVLVVGYDLEAALPFIIVKNSWGDKWGEEGFARISIGQRTTGPCFIAGSDQLVYPSI